MPEKLECEEIPDAKAAIAKVGDPEAPILEGMMKSDSPLVAAGSFATRHVLYVLAAIVGVALFGPAILTPGRPRHCGRRSRPGHW